MNELVVAALVGSGILSLLVSLALVLMLMLKQSERRLQDEESFKVMAVKESSKKPGHQTPTAGNQKKRPPGNQQQRQQNAEGGTAQPVSTTKVSNELKLKKHKDIVKWREDHERIFSGSAVESAENPCRHGMQPFNNYETGSE